MTLAFDICLQRGAFLLDAKAEIPSTGITAICGASASGKTSLLRCISGIDNAQGEIRFREQWWQQPGLNRVPAEARGVACVFQDNRLFPHLSVEQNLIYAWQRRFSDSGPGIDAIASELSIKHLLTRSVKDLSGGESRRVAIARALCSAPRLLLLDEPLTGLDAGARHTLVDIILRQQAATGIPMLYVGHDFAEISRLADQVVMLDRGRVQQQGQVVDLSADLDFASRNHDEAAAIICAEVGEQDPEFALTQLNLDSAHRVWLAQVNAETGARLKLRIPARDVSIAIDPGKSSILNTLPCTIHSIAALSEAHNLVRLAVGDQYLLARITRKSAHNLDLKIGDQVLAQIKSAALLGEAGAL